MKGQNVRQVTNTREPPLTWPVEADIICLFATVEGYEAYRGKLCHALACEVNNWWNNWVTTKDKAEEKDIEDIEFHHLLIRVNAHLGMFEAC